MLPHHRIPALLLPHAQQCPGDIRSKGVEKDEGAICMSGQCEPMPAPQPVTRKLAGMDLDWNQHVATAITTA